MSAQPLSPQAQQFSQQLAQLTAKFNIRLIVAAFPDPAGGAPRLIATPGALDAMKPLLAERLGLTDEKELRERLSAEFDSSTAW